MLNLLAVLQKDKFNPRFYVAAATDNMSLQKAQLLENSLADQILCNGLGTCISICAIAFLFKVLGIRCGQSCNNNILELPMLAVSYIDDILYTYSSGLSAKITRNIIGTRLLILEVFIHYSFFGGNIGRDGSCYPTRGAVLACWVSGCWPVIRRLRIRGAPAVGDLCSVYEEEGSSVGTWEEGFE
ncbi:hypothetical protein HN51_052491, partial [Arachis hypogaea]